MCKLVQFIFFFFCSKISISVFSIEFYFSCILYTAKDKHTIEFKVNTLIVNFTSFRTEYITNVLDVAIFTLMALKNLHSAHFSRWSFRTWNWVWEWTVLRLFQQIHVKWIGGAISVCRSHDLCSSVFCLV